MKKAIKLLLIRLIPKQHFLLLLITLIPFIAFPQSEVVSEKLIEVTKDQLLVQEILDLIKKESNISLYYNDIYVKPERSIHLEIKPYKLTELLDLIIQDTDLEYLPEDDYIIIRIKNNVIFDPDKGEYTISGYVVDKITGEKLPGTTVNVTGTTKGAITDLNGYFSMVIDKSEMSNISFSFVGYKKESKQLLHNADQVINISLESSNQLEEIEIIAPQDSPLYKAANLKSAKITTHQLENMPTLGGEVEVLKVIQFYPGVLSNIGGSGGLNVRGGNDGQNLILLDGFPVYSVSHVANTLSPFNAGAIQNINVYKGGAGVQHPGHLSSTIDIEIKEGNREKIKGKLGIGIITTNFNLDGPIGKKTSFMFSARRSYIDYLIKPISKRLGVDVVFNFYDIHSKVTHWATDRDKISLNLYLGRDRFKTVLRNDDNSIFFRNEDRRFKLKNISLGLHWSKVLNDDTYSNLWISYRKQDYNSTTYFDHRRDINIPDNLVKSDTRNTASVGDFSLKWEFEKVISRKHIIKSGVNNIVHIFKPVDYNYGINDEPRENFSTQKLNAVESSIFFKDEFIINDKWQLNSGIRLTAYTNKNKMYFAFQPRITSRYLINQNSSLKFLYNYSQQFLQPALFYASIVPIYNWLPSTKNIKPGKVHQIALGYFKNLGKNFEASIETFYKRMDHLVTYNSTFGRILTQNNWRNNLIVGKGRSYGAEFYLRKKKGSLTGWMGYTLSWSERKFEGFNNNNWYPFTYDRRHNITFTLVKEWDKKKDKKRLFSLNWMYGSGLPYSAPTQKYPLPGELSQIHYLDIFGFEERNNFRLKPEHRLDISFTFIRKKRKGNRKWIFGLYNVYNKKNPYIYTSNYNNGEFTYTGNSYLVILPTITYEFRF